VTAPSCPGDHPDPETLAGHPDRGSPAGRCDVDHNLPWPHGPTCECNLCCLCRHHHRLKTHGRWKVVNHGNGYLAWTTPTGRVIHTRPDP
jgi:hypothetical protein